MTTVCQTGLHSDHDVYASQCPCRAMLDLLANKWSALAIGALEDGPQRFGQLQRHLQGVSPKVLTQSLRRLEEFGLVDRTVYPAVPLHVEYSLTELGHSAAVPLRMLRSWVEDNIDNSALTGTPAASCETAATR
ncbi:helix-turn-helix domain-containing protein [Lentzea sp.]|uniref:winged helix-turn-helix transcriptional regulator n=1 Tax=Lentzea sp. TaxID=56099 RepID=UPI002BAB4AFE|nr:helix-turn-helix domain-containing protein [Lentzea sp.]HUQ56415.1 helix-turn-helix domain-containing protein [Lentzea sp.]